MQGSEFLNTVNPINFLNKSREAFEFFKNPNAYGSENFYKLANDGVSEIVYTDGVRDLFISLSAYWLRDIVNSYSRNIFSSTEEFYSVFILKNPSSPDEAIFLMTDGNDKIIIKQIIPYTDISLNVQMYLEFDGCSRYTLMLPSER